MVTRARTRPASRLRIGPGPGPAADLFNEGLPAEVRQLLQMSGGEYERTRSERIALNWRYYKNTQYDPDFLSVGSALTASEIQRAKQLWEGIRPLYNICTDAVDKDVELCFKSARPLPFERNKAMYARFQEKWETEHWGLEQDRSVFYGAALGSSYLRVIEGYLEGNNNAPSRLSVYSPEIMTVLRDQHIHNRIIAAKIEYQYVEESTKPRSLLGGVAGWVAPYIGVDVNRAVGLSSNEEVHTKTIIITREAYYTFRDGTLWAFGDLGNSWPNRLGVVPIVDVPFKDIGEDLGLPTFHNILPTLDAVNELASFFGNIVRMNGDPQLIAYGIDPKSNIVKSTESDGTANVWFVPLPANFQGALQQQPARFEYLVWKGESAAPMLDYLKMVKADCEREIPEMQIKSAGTRTGSGFERSLDQQDLQAKLDKVRQVQFAACEEALQMGMVVDDINKSNDYLLPGDFEEKLQEARKNYDMFIQADTVLPRDRTAESQSRNTDVADKVISAYTARLERGMTYVEADEEERRIEEERQKEIRWAGELAKATAAAMPQPAQPVQPRNGTKPTPATKRGQPIASANKSQRGQPGTRANNPSDN